MLPHQNNLDHSGVRNCPYKQDIKSTECQITSIIKEEWNTFKLILIFEVMIDTFQSTEFVLSCHLGISMSYYFV